MAEKHNSTGRNVFNSLILRKFFRKITPMAETTKNSLTNDKVENELQQNDKGEAKDSIKSPVAASAENKEKGETEALLQNDPSAKPTQQTAFDSAATLLAQYGYTLGEQLGKGSYAVVRSANSKKHKRKVAIKIISKKKAPDDYLTKFLPREIQVLKRLKHESCVSLLEAIETNSRIYLIMNLAENGDLLEYIRDKGPLTDDNARVFFQQLISATEYFHSHGVVHRDLKCENLLLDVNFTLIVSDFGFAKVQQINQETGKKKLSQTFCGSYAYAPPEILRGIPYDGTIADIWSLGVVLYTMVNASLPFDDSNLKTLLEQVMRPVHFSSRKKISPEVKDLISKMLVPNVDKRASIKEIQIHCWFKGEKLPVPSTSKQDVTEIKE
ncbi:testis-specific serine/threonine-protein kinase 3 [Hydra vulgaris]|uniref:Testis-specific serine/threonine-protein kinase 3 n=1 Tax=Hydra vulgaris TaxID=6087 RepID=A0ABM4B5U8_HYDVU